MKASCWKQEAEGPRGWTQETEGPNSNHPYMVICTNIIENLAMITLINPFLPIVLFWSPWKHQKTFGFLMFSGKSKRSIGKRRVKNIA